MMSRVQQLLFAGVALMMESYVRDALLASNHTHRRQPIERSCIAARTGAAV